MDFLLQGAIVTSFTQGYPGAAISRARVPRQRRPDGLGDLPLTLALIAAGAALVCFAAAAVGLLSATVAREPRTVTAVIAPAVPPPAIRTVTAALSPEQKAEQLRARLDAERRSAARAEQNLDEARAHVASLGARRTELLSAIDRRRADLAAAEDAARRAAAEKQTAAVRRQELQAESASLRARIAQLNTSIADAERQAHAQAAREVREPQLVECVKDAVILQPQQVRIPMAVLNNGTLATAIRRVGVHFVVRRDGFATFMVARGIARGVGTLVISEPRKE